MTHVPRAPRVESELGELEELSPIPGHGVQVPPFDLLKMGLEVSESTWTRLTQYSRKMGHGRHGPIKTGTTVPIF